MTVTDNTTITVTNRYGTVSMTVPGCDIQYDEFHNALLAVMLAMGYPAELVLRKQQQQNNAQFQEAVADVMDKYGEALQELAKT